VTRTHVTSVIDRMLARGARRKANAVLAFLKQMFAHGVVRGLVDADPTYGFTKKHAGGKERSRERALSPPELAELAQKLPTSGLGETYQAALRFLLATGARVGEFNLAQWPHVDLGARTWTIPKEHAKNEREHVVHLSGFALEQLGVLARYKMGPYLMPSRKSDAPIDEKAISKALRDRQRSVPLKGRAKACGTLLLAGGEWTPHDLRRTFSTRLGDLGIAPHIVERCLNHTMQGVMAVYNRNDYLPERRAALEAWGGELSRIFAVQPAAGAGNVVQLMPAIAERAIGVRAR
jgi:integrase